MPSRGRIGWALKTGSSQSDKLVADLGFAFKCASMPLFFIFDRIETDLLTKRAIGQFKTYSSTLTNRIWRTSTTAPAALDWGLTIN